ncbi:hypothetical protein BJ508DRAFT_221872 [Ascobolus immersus RN42]|uniref:Vacuolar assembly protein DID2 n=1 Tax=Ascobolus immersus RN42 TaxID=1160509 RepID=A0A3N4IJ10_ASCIM|nr:hypothetical protein BJ508DRAFT_221872 [Ascobolus immersus RN42]
MSGLENALFNLKFTSKQLNRQAVKAGKEEQTERNKVKKAIMAGNHDIARINAQNAVRKSQERLNLLRLASRLDAVASRVQTAVTMRNVSKDMVGVVKGMDVAMKNMNLDRISQVMEKFEQQFEDVDVMTGYYENATQTSTAVGTPQEDVERLMSQVADEAGLQLNQSLADATPVQNKPVVSQEEEEGLESRLRALRN